MYTVELPTISLMARGQTVSFDIVCKFLSILPKKPLPKSEFYASCEELMPGFTTTYSQVVRQIGLIYEDYSGVIHPRFDRELAVYEIMEYMQNVAEKYYVPNPYTQIDKQISHLVNLPVNLHGYLSKLISDSSTPVDLKDKLNKVFLGVTANNADKVITFLEQFANIDRNGIFKNYIQCMYAPKPSIPNNYRDALAYYEYLTPDFLKIDKKPQKVMTKALDYSHQTIFYGAPGTGKSNRIEQLTDDNNRIRTTFHPDSDYATFVGCYKPVMEMRLLRDLAGHIVQEGDPLKPIEQGQIVYEYVPQPFILAYTEAWKRYNEQNNDPFYLVIEEINRGNCAQIFGDIFQLLDRDSQGYSRYKINPDKDIQRYLEQTFSSCSNLDEDIRKGKSMRLPPNLYIWATMNTSDQSLFPIDSAFKRRWDWEYVPIQYNNSDWLIPVGDKNYRWSDFQKAINDKVFHIDHLEDKMMGDWFVVADKDKRVSKHTLINKVLFYLWNDVCKDGEGDIFKMTLSDHKEHEVIFSQFFGEDALVDERLQGLMRYNKVEPVE